MREFRIRETDGVLRFFVGIRQADHELAVVDVVDDGVRDGVIDEGEELVCFDAPIALRGEEAVRFFALADVAGVFDHAEVDGAGWQTEVDGPVTGEGVLIRASGCVVGLAVAADDAHAGGEHDEEVQGCAVAQESFVDVERSLDFGTERRVVVFQCHFVDDVVLFSRFSDSCGREGCKVAEFFFISYPDDHR